MSYQKSKPKQTVLVRSVVVFGLLTLSCFLTDIVRAGNPASIRIALAAIPKPANVTAGLEKIRAVLADCQSKRVQIVCFPETYLPGLRGADLDLPAPDQPAMEKALRAISDSCRDSKVAAIVGLEWVTPRGLENRAYVVSAEGQVLGYQTKNQITPGGEADNYVAEGKRQMFEISGVKFGIVICHEGWRYPETVRWAAVRGAQIVFQPQVTGSNEPRAVQPKWGKSFYELAMQCRAQENAIYFASVNRAMRSQNSATSLIDPAGKLLQHVPYGEESLVVADLDLTKATRVYAKRFQPSLYEEKTGLSAASSSNPVKPTYAEPYLELLKLFPEESQGRGIDRGGNAGSVAQQPMTYGLILSAESLRFQVEPSDEGRRRIRQAARWLVDNSRLARDAKPGWGLPHAWDYHPENSSYTITTAVAVEGLLDALSIPSFWTPVEKDEIVKLLGNVHVRWCRELWVEGFTGGFFAYSPVDHQAGWFCVNAPAMYLGVLARFLKEHGSAISEDERQLLRDRGDALAKAIVATATLRQGAPYWNYIVPPNSLNSQRPNDLIHQVYILWGIEAYRDLGGTVKLPWTRANAIDSVERFWKDNRIRFYAQDESTVKPGNREAPANLWGTGMLLAFYARWGTAQQTERCIDAIANSYGPFPQLRVLPRDVSQDDKFYPRDAAHVLFGLAHALHRK